MTDMLELKAECVRNDISLSVLAEQIGVNPATLYRKVNGKTEFNRNELMIMKSVLHLDDDRFMRIFFAS